MDQRTCSKCGVSKPETLDFFRHRGTKDRGGLRPDCRVCSDARDRAYFAANKTRMLAQMAEYRLGHKAQIKACDAAWVNTPKGRASRRAAVAKWNKTEAARVVFLLNSARRRAVTRGANADLTAEQWAACLVSFGQRCAYCNSAGAMTQEHVIPLINGGHHTASNIVPACMPCNASKFTAHMATWFRRQPFFSPIRLARIEAHISI